MGSKIYPKVHENPRAFFSSSSPNFLESSIQYPWGVGLHHFAVPFFHVYGFTFSLGAIVLSEMVVVMESFSLKAMLGAMERKETKKAFKAMLPNILVIQVGYLS